MNHQVSFWLAAVLLMGPPLYETAHGQFATIIDVPPDTPPDSIGSDTQLNLCAGGSLANDFRVGDSSGTEGSIELNAYGGETGRNLTVYAGGTVNVFDGQIGGSFDDFPSLVANPGSVVNITGGSIGSKLRTFPGSTLRIAGAHFGDEAEILGEWHLVGGEFRLDGAPIAGLESVGDSQQVSLPNRSVLSGTLADGTPFVFSAADRERLSRVVALEVSQLPGVGPLAISLPEDPLPRGLRSGQTLAVGPDGTVPDNYNAAFGNMVSVNGGAIGRNFEIVSGAVAVAAGDIGHSFDAFDGTSVTVSGGTIESGFQAFGGSTVVLNEGAIGGLWNLQGSHARIHGGSVGSSFLVQSGSDVEITGGTVGWSLVIEGSRVDITGGTIGHSLLVGGGSTLSIAGGSIGNGMRAFGGSEVSIRGGTVGHGFGARSGSIVSLFGTEFLLDGVDITNSLEMGVATILSERNVTLSGLLEDGSPFAFDLNTAFMSQTDQFAEDATLFVTRVAWPADFDADGDVDGDDFLVWQANFGTTTAADPSTGDADEDGDVDGDDFLIWQASFSSSQTASTSRTGSSVPEAASWTLAGWLSVVVVARYQRRRYA